MADRRGISGRALARVESGDSLGAPLFVIHFKSAVLAAATATTSTEYIFNGNAPFGFRIIRVDFICTEAAGDVATVQITDGTNGITDAVDSSAKGDTDIFSAGEINDAYNFIPQNGTLALVQTEDSAITGMEVNIYCVRANGL